jgi:hypothetical protein
VDSKTKQSDEIYKMAREAGFADGVVDIVGFEGFAKFANLVAAYEREECAKVCEEQMKAYMSSQYTTDPLGGFHERFAAKRCADAIRARGEK